MKQIDNSFTVPCEKYKIVAFTSLIMKSISRFFVPLRFPVKLICFNGFGSVSSVC